MPSYHTIECIVEKIHNGSNLLFWMCCFLISVNLYFSNQVEEFVGKTRLGWISLRN